MATHTSTTVTISPHENGVSCHIEPKFIYGFRHVTSILSRTMMEWSQPYNEVTSELALMDAENAILTYDARPTVRIIVIDEDGKKLHDKVVDGNYEIN